MSPTKPLPLKKDVALALLERSSVYVHLDPRHDTVVVPQWFKKQPHLVLQIGLNMPVPIPDLRVDDDGISCTLSFNRAPFFCALPWASVFAMAGEDGRNMVWPEDVPVEVARPAQVNVTDEKAQKEPRVAMTQARKENEGAPPAASPEGALSPETGATRMRDIAVMPKAKRPRKRPALAAMSSDGGQEEAGAPAVRANHAGQEQQAHTNHTGSSRPSMVPLSGGAHSAKQGARKKRELPPYLRVVK